MRIGIDASRAFIPERTGIEEYSYQIIKHLREVVSAEDEVVLYVRKKLEMKSWKLNIRTPSIDFELPQNWRVRGIWAPRFWTQIGLSLEMLFHRPDILFVPAHTVPLIHPKRTIVTVHGLEYEFCPESYSWWERLYMGWSIRFSVWAASRVIAVSENTKRDLVRLYKVPEEKILVIYEGVSQLCHSGLDPESRSRVVARDDREGKPHFLFVGRLETRKNVAGIIEAFEMFKSKTGLPHQLVLAGKPGYGYAKIKKQIAKSKYQDAIHELGYVTEAEKWALLKKADAFVFPSLYEGFGLPVLEAQAVGTPVITATTSSLPEIAGDGAILVESGASKKLARAFVMLATDQARRADIIDKATRNADRFSWAASARAVAKLLIWDRADR